jgi:hypothetical protein
MGRRSWHRIAESYCQVRVEPETIYRKPTWHHRLRSLKGRGGSGFTLGYRLILTLIRLAESLIYQTQVLLKSAEGRWYSDYAKYAFSNNDIQSKEMRKKKAPRRRAFF